MSLIPQANFVINQHPANPDNIGGTLAPEAVRLFVVHIAQAGNESSIAAWFANPAAQVSAHFSVDTHGLVFQHVPLDRVAWAEQDYNDHAISIEHVGYSGDQLSRRQLDGSIMLLETLHEHFPHVPLRRTSNPAGTGVIGHGELGVEGGDHPDCPGTPVLYQFNIALRGLSTAK